MKIIIDAFGGDNAPEEIIAGGIAAINEEKGFTAVFAGKEDVIKEHLKNYEYDSSRVEILPAEEVITCEEEPTSAFRKKPCSSIALGLKSLKEDEDTAAFVSAGSTGAVLVGATLKPGRISGVNRPALCPVLPTATEKNVLLLDSGANADCKSINLYQFAVMGSAFAEAMGVKNPVVALLSNGTEDEKGNALTHEVFPILKEAAGINFAGNCEARDILSGKYDVVVTDGFSGNVALGEIYSSFRGKMGGLLLKPAFKNLKTKLDYNNRGGALFLGVNKIVIKAHGSSKRTAIKSAVLQAVSYAKEDLIGRVKAKLSENAREAK